MEGYLDLIKEFPYAQFFSYNIYSWVQKFESYFGLNILHSFRIIEFWRFCVSFWKPITTVQIRAPDPIFYAKIRPNVVALMCSCYLQDHWHRRSLGTELHTVIKMDLVNTLSGGVVRSSVWHHKSAPLIPFLLLCHFSNDIWLDLDILQFNIE